MKYLALITAALLSLNLSAATISGVELPDNLSVTKQPLALNGAGVRSKFFMDIYVAGLYLPEKEQAAQNIIEQDQPMGLRLHVTSGLLSAEKMQNATLEGFEKSTNGNLAPIQKNVDVFIDSLKDEIAENDVFEFIYVPDQGVSVYKNGELKTQVPSLEFKQALFGIWLSDEPVQDDLKAGLLGSL
ncbi:chalcone isomerase [Bermanella marisrubri]|uniref:Chalcone isomerase domain-containing protein n=1 Tax=Bermanella marisrubri TaxID=207949 RepID=Q1N6G2_9GAMM|nr:chalcone isomerase family protein [Bermanella marisrubri]EAT13630.1 hypothetical protein RED65_09569 [Oceanobacter sp. RED65] [Bermanella marisrubri]QIZ84416.1 chalcone isomerase [Bermanella marisrubri]